MADEQMNLARDGMKKLFFPGPFLLAMTSLLNFKFDIPPIMNVMALIVSIPATLLFIVASWSNASASLDE